MKYIRLFRNKYYLTLLGFSVWMMFFDRNDLISQFNYRQKLRELKKDKRYYQQEIKKNQEDLHHLISDPENLERFAREKYLMKKDNEDVFILEEVNSSK